MRPELPTRKDPKDRQAELTELLCLIYSISRMLWIRGLSFTAPREVKMSTSSEVCRELDPLVKYTIMVYSVIDGEYTRKSYCRRLVMETLVNQTQID